MKEYSCEYMTKAQVDGVKELIDLCHNGYFICFSSHIHTAIAYGLRHSHNGRKLTMYIGQYHYLIAENGVQLKAVYYDVDGKVISPEN